MRTPTYYGAIGVLGANGRRRARLRWRLSSLIGALSRGRRRRRCTRPLAGLG
jgi:hypothetical protein